MEKRNIALYIVLTIITCGIYGYVWMYKIINDTNSLNNEYQFEAGLTIFLSIITCGIYGIYWFYKTGQAIYNVRIQKGLRASDNSILYLILAIFGWGIINYGIIQSELNEMV